jgi:hypothetical protein
MKEYSRGLYSNTLKWFVSDWPLYFLRLVNGILYTVIVWRLTSQNNDADVFGFAVMSFMFMVLASCVLSECVIFASPDKRSCYLGITVCAFLNFIFSGLFIKAQSLPHWMGPWVPSISMIRWNMQANFINNYEDNPTAIPIQSVYTSVLNLFGWGGKTKWFCFYMILLDIFIYKTISFIVSGLSAVFRKGGKNVNEQYIDQQGQSIRQ